MWRPCARGGDRFDSICIFRTTGGTTDCRAPEGEGLHDGHVAQPLSLPSHWLSEASSFPHAVRIGINGVKTSEERWPTDSSHVKMATLLGQQDLVPQHKTGLFFPSAPIPPCPVHGQRLAGICTHGRGGRQAAAVDICPAVHGSLASAPSAAQRPMLCRLHLRSALASAGGDAATTVPAGRNPWSACWVVKNSHPTTSALILK